MHRKLYSLTIVVVSLLLFVTGAGAAKTQKPKGKTAVTSQTPSVRFINRAPRGYSHVVEVRGGRTLYISGQISLDKSGGLVGRGDFRAQTRQVFENLKARLEEAGATFKNVVKLNYYITDASDLAALREVRDAYLNTEQPPASTLVVVKRLVQDEYLIEVEAIAAVAD